MASVESPSMKQVMWPQGKDIWSRYGVSLLQDIVPSVSFTGTKAFYEYLQPLQKWCI